MNAFDLHTPTAIHFGKGAIRHLSELAAYGKKVLLCYGGGSIIKQGIYDEAVSVLAEAGLETVPFGGIEPNPKIASVRAGTALCKEHGIDMVLGIGGGSVMDASKVIAAGALYDGDVWDLVLDSSLIERALPVFAVVTLAATGSEMDEFAVISDLDARRKQFTGSEILKPKMAILDPVYTCSVPAFQTAAGTADIMSHILESYFTNVPGTDLQRNLCEALLKTVVQYGPAALRQPDDYTARSSLMWTATLAINGILKKGAEVPWCLHPMEHELSAFYDISHGAGLAALTPVWMDYVLSEKTAPAFAGYGVRVFGIEPSEDVMETARAAIARTRVFLFEELGLPEHLGELGVDDRHIDEMVAGTIRDGRCAKAYVPLSPEDVAAIYRRAI